MTDSVLAKMHGVSRQTIIAWKKSGKLRRKPGPPTKNRRGKSSYEWEFVLDSHASATEVPRWQLFERKCKAAGYDPMAVMELLLSRCRSEHLGETRGDPDFFAASIYTVFAGAPSFLDSLFHGGGDPSRLETAIAQLIRADNGEPITLGRAAFQEAWTAAKQFVGAAIQQGRWRFNHHPAVFNFNGKGAILMRSRWHNRLSSPHHREQRDLMLAHIGFLFSAVDGEFFPDDRAMNALLLKINKLRLDFGDEMRKKADLALQQFKWLWLGDGDNDFGAAFETRNYGPEHVKLDTGKLEAIKWIVEHTGAASEDVVQLAYFWARRYQDQLSTRPTQALINALFQCSRAVPIPKTEGWNPEECVETEVPLAFYNSEANFDWANYHLGPQTAPRPARKTAHEYDGGDMTDAEGQFNVAHKVEARLDKKSRRENAKQESDYVPAFDDVPAFKGDHGGPVSKWKDWRDFGGYAANRYGDG